MKKRRNFEVLLSFIVMGAIGIGIVGCFPGTEKWREEVQLSDGRIIVIDRETQRESGGGEIVHNRSGTKPKEHRLRFGHPDRPKQIIEWRGEKREAQGYPEFPLVLDLEDGKPVIYTTVGVETSVYMYSKYIYHKDGMWREEELPVTFAERKTNLFLGVGINMPFFIDLETKRKENKKVDYGRDLKQVGPERRVIVH